MNSGDRLTVSAVEAAQMLGVSRTAIYDAVRRGELANVGVGDTVRIPLVAIERRFADAGAPIALRDPLIST